MTNMTRMRIRTSPGLLFGLALSPILVLALALILVLALALIRLALRFDEF